MKWIHKHVLTLLTKNESLNFASLKPEGVDSNLFTYHLGQLVGDGYVEKREKIYTLTREGKRFVAGFSLAEGKPTKVPRTFVALFAENKAGEVLLYKWSRQPYLGHVGLPFSRVRYGESIFEAAENNVRYKTGSSGKPEYLGDAYVIVRSGVEVTTHYLVHLFGLSKVPDDPKSDGLTGEPFWGDVGKYDPRETVYGTKELIDLCRNSTKPFFTELEINKY